MSQDSIRLGSLIKYYSIDDEIVYGIVTEHIEAPEDLPITGRPAVQVLWMDDTEYTIESVKNIRDPDIEYMQVISENR